jgi:hypothetical protein
MWLKYPKKALEVCLYPLKIQTQERIDTLMLQTNVFIRKYTAFTMNES